MVHHSNRKYPKPKTNKKVVAPAISKKKMAAAALAAASPTPVVAAPVVAAPKKTIVKKTVVKKTTTKAKSVAASLAATTKADDFEALPSSDDEEEEEKNGFESTDDEEEVEEEVEEEEETEETEEVADEGKTSQFENLKIPTPAAATDATANDSNVIYVGRVPHGFYESQMRAYFGQFGTILKLRLSRNKKTGKSKHFAFLEFSTPDVAQIVADTMDNYLLFGHILKCKVVPKDKIHEDLFVGANKTFRAIPWGKIAKHKNDSPKSAAKWEKLTKKNVDKSQKKKEILAELGINYSI